MIAICHAWALLRARLGRRAHDRRALAKRKLETLLREHGMPRSQARDICWHFFNDTESTP